MYFFQRLSNQINTTLNYNFWIAIENSYEWNEIDSSICAINLMHFNAKSFLIEEFFFNGNWIKKILHCKFRVWRVIFFSCVPAWQLEEMSSKLFEKSNEKQIGQPNRFRQIDWYRFSIPAVNGYGKLIWPINVNTNEKFVIFVCRLGAAANNE